MHYPVNPYCNEKPRQVTAQCPRGHKWTDTLFADFSGIGGWIRKYGWIWLGLLPADLHSVLPFKAVVYRLHSEHCPVCGERWIITQTTLTK